MRPENQNAVVHRHEVHAVKDSGDSVSLLEDEDPKDVSEDTIAPSQTASDKKTDETLEPQKPASGGYIWRISSGIIGSTAGAVSGAVGLGIGGIKWAASKGYTAGSVVVDTTKTVAGKVPSWKPKDKKE